MHKSKTTALLLCLFLGYLGVHRFYAGRIGSGVLQLLTGGGFVVWAVWDFIQILRGKFKDGEGNLLTA